MSQRLTRPLLMPALALLSLAAKGDDYVYGPEPDWNRYKAIGETAIRAALPSSVNWQIDWPNGYIAAGWNKKGNALGYTTCGVVRALDPVGKGGYASNPFVVVIDYDRVQLIDYRPTPHNSIVNVMCAALVRQGKLPPAGMMHAAIQPTEIRSLGLTVRPVADGAYVTAVAPSSPASVAGITAGMVITRANGIALAGMGAATTKILSSGTAALVLDTASGQHIEIKRAP